MRARSILAAVAAVACIAAAADPGERLQDPAQEARARHLFTTFRCVVCQNESIDDSNAEIAGDIRRIVRAQVAEGRSDKQITQFLVARYGEFILLKPSFSAGNALLWLAPALVLLAGGGYLSWQARRPRTDDDTLTPAEEAELADALGENGATVPPNNGPNNRASV